MELTLLGTGTSTGIPLLGCHCDACSSTNPKNRRTRPSAVLKVGGQTLLFDTATDLREQALRNTLHHIDAILYTHAHADHVNGLDDVRAFNTLQNMAIPIYANRDTLRRIESFFTHIFDGRKPTGGGKTNVTPHVIDTDPFKIADVTITPIPLEHGDTPVTGYRIGNFAYLTDCKRIPEASMLKLAGVTHIVLDCIRYQPHPTHLNLEEALAIVQQLHPLQTYFTHITHDFEHDRVSQELPPGVMLGYDGMRVTIPLH